MSLNSTRICLFSCDSSQIFKVCLHEVIKHRGSYLTQKVLIKRSLLSPLNGIEESQEKEVAFGSMVKQNVTCKPDGWLCQSGKGSAEATAAECVSLRPCTPLGLWLTCPPDTCTGLQPTAPLSPMPVAGPSSPWASVLGSLSGPAGVTLGQAIGPLIWLWVIIGQKSPPWVLWCSLLISGHSCLI